jgi:hypothetical protein
VGQAGGIVDGLSPGTRFPACHFLRGTRHNLIAFGEVPRLDHLRARWDKLVSIVDATTRNSTPLSPAFLKVGRSLCGRMASSASVLTPPMRRRWTRLMPTSRLI